MKRIQVIIFYSVFILIYLLINYYIFIRGWQGLSTASLSIFRTIYLIVFVIMTWSFMLARFTGKIFPMKAVRVFSYLGGIWLGAMLYFVLLIVLLDLFRGILNLFSLFPDTMTNHWELVKFITFLTVLLIVLILLIIGSINANKIKVTRINIDINKFVPDLKELHIVFASDMHLGHVIGKNTLRRIITTINNLRPDLVLFPGDIVDEEIDPVINNDLGRFFNELDPPLGVFAATGNHEYIGGAEKAVAYLEQYGIQFLRDEIITLNNMVCMVGREDWNMTTFAGKKRKPLGDILNECDQKLPVIVMDHQPVSLAEAVENDVDLQISGHTHNGQMWPLNYLTKRIFKMSWGYKKVENTHFYVSCGAGTWGPRMRIGGFGEVVSIRLRSE